MKFVKVDEVPGKPVKKRLRVYLDEFMTSNIKIARIDFNERDYKSSSVARACFARSVANYGYPINVIQRGNEVYLSRRDM